jgi:hypothetical protein
MNHEKWGFSDILLRCLSFVPVYNCRNFKKVIQWVLKGVFFILRPNFEVNEQWHKTII